MQISPGIAFVWIAMDRVDYSTYRAARRHISWSRLVATTTLDHHLTFNVDFALFTAAVWEWGHLRFIQRNVGYRVPHFGRTDCPQSIDVFVVFIFESFASDELFSDQSFMLSSIAWDANMFRLTTIEQGSCVEANARVLHSLEWSPNPALSLCSSAQITQPQSLITLYKKILS